jgi:uncharacterized membrane protein
VIGGRKMLVLTALIAEVGAFLIAGLVYYGLKKRYGWTVASFFLLGSVLWTTPLETLGISTGSYTYSAFAGSLYPGYPGYLVWIGIVPLWIEMGWFIVSASLFMIFHDVLMQRSKAATVAILAGLCAVDLDLMIDPVASSNRLWVWIGPSLTFMGIPLYNYVGWFLMIFFYDFIIWNTVITFSKIKVLSVLETKLFSLKEGLTSVSLKKRASGFLFRILVFEVLAIFLIKLASVVL